MGTPRGYHVPLAATPPSFHPLTPVPSNRGKLSSVSSNALGFKLHFKLHLRSENIVWKFLEAKINLVNCSLSSTVKTQNPSSNVVAP